MSMSLLKIGSNGDIKNGAAEGSKDRVHSEHIRFLSEFILHRVNVLRWVMITLVLTMEVITGTRFKRRTRSDMGILRFHIEKTRRVENTDPQLKIVKLRVDQGDVPANTQYWATGSTSSATKPPEQLSYQYKLVRDKRSLAVEASYLCDECQSIFHHEWSKALP